MPRPSSTPKKCGRLPAPEVAYDALPGFAFAHAAKSAQVFAPLAGPAADRAREALDHYNQAIERLKSGDWVGFGTELDAMRGLLEDMSRHSGGH